MSESRHATVPLEALDVFECPLEGSAIVEASAGTGKTWNICGLYVRLLIERGLPVSGILVMTFTTAATAELRDRIRQRLVELQARLSGSAGASGDPFAMRLMAALQRRGVSQSDALARIKVALAEFDEASIFTIHGFCQRAATDHAFAARLPFESEVLVDAGEILLAVAEDFWRRRVVGAGLAADDVHRHMVTLLLQENDSPATYAEVLAMHLKLPLACTRWPEGIGRAAGGARDARGGEGRRSGQTGAQRAGGEVGADAPDTIVGEEAHSGVDRADVQGTVDGDQRRAGVVTDFAARLAALHAAYVQVSASWARERDLIVGQVDRARAHGILKRNIYTETGVPKSIHGWSAWIETGDPLRALGAELAHLPLLTRTKLDDSASASGAKKADQASRQAGSEPVRLPDHPFFAQAEALMKAREAVQQAFSVWRLFLLHELVTEGPALVRRETERRRQLSYDDMLVNLHRRLVPEHDRPDARAEADALARALRTRYPAALIDEFQDTDPVQYGIFSAIYGDAGTRFMVGDPKQAIYGFRGADLPTYLRAKADAGRRYTLNHNQRSSPSLLLALNALFGAQALGGARAGDECQMQSDGSAGRQASSAKPVASSGSPLRAEGAGGPGAQAAESPERAEPSVAIRMPEPSVFMVPGIDYVPVTAGERPRARFRDPGGPHFTLPVTDEPAAASASDGVIGAVTALEAGQSAPSADNVRVPERIPVPLLLWSLPESDMDGKALAAGALRERAADATACEIVRLLGGGGEGRVPATLDGRPIVAGEIAVLVRAHSHARIMRQALARRGVRAVMRMRDDVFHSVQALELVQVMAAVLEPARPGLARAALATSLMGWDAERLLGLQRDEAAWSAVVESFAVLNRLWRQRGVGVMLRRWMRDTHASTRLLAQQDGERSLTNLLHLGEALHAASRDHATPEALLGWMQVQCQRRGEEVEERLLRLESDEHLVQIVTVHSAKGLEYAVVFCPFLWTAVGKGRNAPRGPQPDCYHDPDTGATVLDYRHLLESSAPAGGDLLTSTAGQTLASAYSEDRVKQLRMVESASEELRLIYVALTRAQHRCVLVIGGKRSAGGGAKASKGTKGTDGTKGTKRTKGAKGGKATTEGDGTAATNAVSGATDASATPDGAAPPGAKSTLAAAMVVSEHGEPRAPQVSKTLLDWIVAGKGLTPQQWLKEGAPVDTVDAGWRAVKEAAGGGVLIKPLPEVTGSVAWGATSDLRPAQVQPLPSVLPQPWRIGSYSGLVHGAGDEHGGEDHDLRAPAPVGSALRGRAERVEGDGPGLPPPEDDPVWLVGGREVGTAVHAMFEQIEFTDPSTWPAGVEAALARLPEPRARAGGAPDTLALRRARLARLLENTLTTPLPLDDGAPLELRALAARARRVELEFHLPVGPAAAAQAADLAGLDADGLACDRLAAYLQRRGYGGPPLSFPRLRGYLKGFIDLVFEHAGRYYVLDWKTNWLGSDPRRYGPTAVQAEMTRHGYHLQHLLYTVALHRLLTQRLAGYDPHRHLGGAVYLFVRAVRPGLIIDGVPAGVHIHRTPVDVVRELSDLLDGLGARDD